MIGAQLAVVHQGTLRSRVTRCSSHERCFGRLRPKLCRHRSLLLLLLMFYGTPEVGRCVVSFDGCAHHSFSKFRQQFDEYDANVNSKRKRKMLSSEANTFRDNDAMLTDLEPILRQKFQESVKKREEEYKKRKKKASTTGSASADVVDAASAPSGRSAPEPDTNLGRSSSSASFALMPLPLDRRIGATVTLVRLSIIECLMPFFITGSYPGVWLVPDASRS